MIDIINNRKNIINNINNIILNLQDAMKYIKYNKIINY